MLMRADNFIQEQMYKFDQKRRKPDSYSPMGNGPPQQPYGNYASPPPQNFSHPPPQGSHQGPPQGPPAPQGWVQEFDQRNGRWYYVERATGRAQWEPPQAQQFSQNRAGTFPAQQYHQQDHHGRNRTHSQPPPPQHHGQNLSPGGPGPNRPTQSISPHPAPAGRLPPGASYDMKTGQVVTSMFPPGQSAAQWKDEISRI